MLWSVKEKCDGDCTTAGCMKTFVVSLILACLGVTASADTVWTYTGNLRSNNIVVGIPGGFNNPCACALTGSVTFDDAGNVVAWDFTGGILTLTNLNSSGQFGFLFSDGTISHWDILLAGLPAEFFIRTEFNGSITHAIDFSTGGVNVLGNPGTWVESSVPEPSTLVLLGIGLAGLLAGSVARPNGRAFNEP
jgi:PEP-CTERM motif